MGAKLAALGSAINKLAVLISMLCGYLATPEAPARTPAAGPVAAVLARSDVTGAEATGAMVSGARAPEFSTRLQAVKVLIARQVDARIDELLSAPTGTDALAAAPARQQAGEWILFEHLRARGEDHGSDSPVPIARAQPAARRTDALARRWLQLLDPVWGGVYRQRPSPGSSGIAGAYDKLLRDQAGAMEIFAGAYQDTREQHYLRGIERLDEYLLAWLALPDGLFYAGQGGDLPGLPERIGVSGYWALRTEHERRQFGLPPVFESIPAQANAAVALAYLRAHGVTGETNYQAIAARTIDRLRSLNADSPECLSDGGDAQRIRSRAALGLALLALYESSGDADSLDSAAGFAGCLTVESSAADLEGSALTARLMDRLGVHTGDPVWFRHALNRLEGGLALLPAGESIGGALPRGVAEFGLSLELWTRKQGEYE